MIERGCLAILEEWRQNGEERGTDPVVDYGRLGRRALTSMRYLTETIH
jgi:hypothetical protein